MTPESDSQNHPHEASHGVFQRLDEGVSFPYHWRVYAARAAWNLVWAIFFRPSPSRAARWRVFLLRRFGARIATSASIRPSARIIHPWLLAVGEHSSIGDRVRVYNLGQIVIGGHTSISQDVHLCGGTHDYRNPTLPLVRSPITIGSGVWICADAFIGPGVCIGDNVVVGARAVVTKNVPANAVVAGNPARFIRPRLPTSLESANPVCRSQS